MEALVDVDGREINVGDIVEEDGHLFEIVWHNGEYMAKYFYPDESRIGSLADVTSEGIWHNYGLKVVSSCNENIDRILK